MQLFDTWARLKAKFGWIEHKKILTIDAVNNSGIKKDAVRWKDSFFTHQISSFLCTCTGKYDFTKEDVLGYKYRLAELDIYAVATTSIKEVRTIGASKRVS